MQKGRIIKEVLTQAGLSETLVSHMTDETKTRCHCEHSLFVCPPLWARETFATNFCCSQFSTPLYNTVPARLLNSVTALLLKKYILHLSFINRANYFFGGLCSVRAISTVLFIYLCVFVCLFCAQILYFIYFIFQQIQRDYYSMLQQDIVTVLTKQHAFIC